VTPIPPYSPVGGPVAAAGRTLVDSHLETTPGYPQWANGVGAGPSYGSPAVANGPGWSVSGENDGTHLALVTVQIPLFYVSDLDPGFAIASVEFGFDDGTDVHVAGTWIQEKAPSPEGGNYLQLGGSAIVEAWSGPRTFDFVSWGSALNCNASISSDYPNEMSVPLVTLEWLS